MVEDPHVDAALRVAFPDELSADAIDSLFAARTAPAEPISLTQYMGSSARDVIWTGALKPLVVRTRVIHVLEEHGLTGWDTYPVDLLDVPEGDDYRGLSIRGRAGPVDNSKSEIRSRQYPAGEWPVYVGLYFDPDTWDDSDLFVTDDAAMWLFATIKVRSAFAEARIENIDFVPADQFERVEL